MRGLSCSAGFGLVLVSRGSSSIVAHGLLIAGASLVGNRGFQGIWAPVAAASGLSS